MPVWKIHIQFRRANHCRSEKWKHAYRGTQFGEVRSTSHVANNFIGTGLTGKETADTSPRLFPPDSAMFAVLVLIDCACVWASCFRFDLANANNTGSKYKMRDRNVSSALAQFVELSMRRNHCKLAQAMLFAHLHWSTWEVRRLIWTLLWID